MNTEKTLTMKQQLAFLSSEALRTLTERVAAYEPSEVVESCGGLFAEQVKREKATLTDHLRDVSAKISEKQEGLIAPGQRIQRMALADLLHPGNETRGPGVLLTWAIEVARGYTHPYAATLPALCRAVDQFHQMPIGTFLLSLGATDGNPVAFSDALIPVVFPAVSSLFTLLTEPEPYTIHRMRTLLGTAVIDAVRTTLFERLNSRAIEYMDKRAMTLRSRFAKASVYKQALVESSDHSRLVPVVTEFLPADTSQIGEALLYFFESIGLISVAPSGRKEALSVFPTDRVLHGLSRSLVQSALQVVNRPMICPPAPFSSGITGGLWGGYLTVPTPLIHSKGRADFSEDLAGVVASGGFSLDSIHALQCVPYKIDVALLDRLESARTAGHRVGKLLPDFTGAKPCPVDKEAPEDVQKAQRRELAKWYVSGGDPRSSTGSKIRASRALLRAARLEIDAPALYFPASLDFRGRIYQAGRAGLSPQGGKEAKALLVFADSVPCTVEQARDAQQLALAAAFGQDKGTFDERRAFAIDIMPEVYRWALNESLGWLEADDPAGALSAALTLFEIRDRDPADVLTDARACHAIYRVDGTCNGLQHIAALVSDYDLAKSVAVVGGERPADLYTEIGREALDVLRGVVDGREMTKVTAPKKLREGETLAIYTSNAIASRRELAGRLLELFDARPKLLRKLAKSPTMTHGYGSTTRGKISACRTVLDELHAAGSLPVGFLKTDEKGDTLRDRAALAAVFGASVDAALARRVSGLKNVSRFLCDISGVLSKAGILTTWATPDGFPVFCPYYEQARKRAWVRLASGERVKIRKLEDTDVIDARKAKTGICPNVIHSLDATHLRSVTGLMNEIGAQLSTIHDSFGCHIANASAMDQAIRESFRSLHADRSFLVGILEDAKDRLNKAGNSDLVNDLPELPTAGGLDINEVIRSAYFFS